METATGRHFFYIPGCASLPPALERRLAAAPLVFFDGTTWRDDEMPAAGRGCENGDADGAHEHGGRRRARSPPSAPSPSTAKSIPISTTPTRCCWPTRTSGGRRRRPAGRSLSTAWRSSCERPAVSGCGCGGPRPGGAAAGDRRCALSRQASVPCAPARRPARQGAGAGLGAQPLLLPGGDPAQGRGADQPPRRPGAAPGVAAAHPRTRRLRRRSRRHRALAGARPTASASTAPTSSRKRASCRRSASPSRPMSASSPNARRSKRSPRR